MTKKTIIQTETLKKQLKKDLQSVHNMAEYNQQDFDCGDIELAEYSAYINLCIKKLLILNKTVNAVKVLDKDFILNYTAETNNFLEQLKSKKTTCKKCLNENVNCTCKALLKSFTQTYSLYLDQQYLTQIVTM